MNSAAATQDLITRYLLDDLSETDREQAETRLFSEPEFLAEFQAICHDLVDDYVQGHLSPETQLKFEAHLHRNAWLREQVYQARALLKVADRARGSEKYNRDGTENKAQVVAFRSWPKATGYWLNAIAAVLVIGLLMAVLWIFFVNPRQKAQQKPASVTPAPATPSDSAAAASLPPSVVAEPGVSPDHKATDKKAPAQAKSLKTAAIVASLFLSPDITVRDTGNMPLLRIPAGEGRVQIEVEVRSAGGNRFRLLLQNETGKVIHQWSALRAKPVQGLQVLTLQIPAHSLLAGEYQIKIYAGPDFQQLQQQHSFQIQRK
jgi:anti-sigma factor RsiW